MKPTPEEIKTYLKLLEETPRRIASVSRGVDGTRLHIKPEGDSWSANDILAHLRSCADVWGKTIQEMLINDNPTLPHVHPRQWVKKTDYPRLDFHESLKAFTSQRKELLKVLKNLAFADWSRTSMIKGREHTIFTQVRRMATHENVHCDQIKEILKSQL
jgi:hypothetical protein